MDVIYIIELEGVIIKDETSLKNIQENENIITKGADMRSIVVILNKT